MAKWEDLPQQGKTCEDRGTDGKTGGNMGRYGKMGGDMRKGFRVMRKSFGGNEGGCDRRDGKGGTTSEVSYPGCTTLAMS